MNATKGFGVLTPGVIGVPRLHIDPDLKIFICGICLGGCSQDYWVTTACMTEPTSQAPTDGFQGTEAVNQVEDTYGGASTAVVLALSEAKAVDPLELEDPLHDWLDPDALDAVVDSIESGYVSFEVESHRIRIDADRTITVEDVE